MGQDFLDIQYGFDVKPVYVRDMKLFYATKTGPISYIDSLTLKTYTSILYVQEAVTRLAVTN